MKKALLIILSAGTLSAQHFADLREKLRAFERRYEVPALELDYRDNFSSLQSPHALRRQQLALDSLALLAKTISAERLPAEEHIQQKAFEFELSLHNERIRLGLSWGAASPVLRGEGLHQLYDGKDWYRYFVRRFTGLDLSPEEVFSMGEKEVQLARSEINLIKKNLGFVSDSAFYRTLRDERQNFTSRDSILFHFGLIDKTVRQNLHKYFNGPVIPPIAPMEWQDAGPNTPPGIYLSKRINPYGADVFQYNFYGGVFNKRCLDWIYLHEAIPGHHLQSQFIAGDGTFYFGTSEGWACYVEKLGDGLGLYGDIFRRLGEHEWNLVRSARLVMEVGLHYYGWDRAKAFSYWKENIKGQDHIAAREISRILSWPGQSLCYKTGALTIKKIVQSKLNQSASLPAAHDHVLRHSSLPLIALL